MHTQKKKYDLAVIGSGPAGEKAVMQAAKLGKKAVLIEKEPKIGGASLHTGTIPSKSLRETMVNLELLQRGSHGINISFNKDITSDEFMHRKQVVIQGQENAFRKNLSKNNIDLIHGSPYFLSPNLIEIQTSKQEMIQVEADYFIIATGSSPHRPNWTEYDDSSVFDSDTILKMSKLPQKITIIGAGVIGCEYACIFAKLGIRVNLIAKDRDILSFLDHEISDFLLYRMRNQRITMRLGEEVKEVKKISDNEVHVCLESGKVLPCSTVLIAAGRNSNSQGFGLEEIGITLGKRGLIDVNSEYQTSVENIYAVGDVIGFPALASTAMIQARIATLHAFKKLENEKMPTDLPFGIWTIPGVAMVGKTEEQLTKEKIPYEIGVAHFKEVVRAHIMGEEEGILKLLFNPDSLELLGVHIIGPRAPEMIHLGQSVMYYSGTIEYFMNAVFNYPTLDEAYRIAAFNGVNRLSCTSL
ncbi:MAG: NAD(P) transhydrogenase [bacterium]|jgi:NAD(P) transhydrogenase